MADTKHLSLRGRKWWYVRDIPKAVRAFMAPGYTGKAHYRRNLNTSDLLIAQTMRPQLNAEFLAEVALARKASHGEEDAKLRSLASELRVYGNSGDGGRDDLRPSIIEDLAQEQAMQIERTAGHAAAERFYRRATDSTGGTEIDHHLETWIAMSPAAPRTDMKRRKFIGDLANWRSTLYAERITRAAAREFVDEVLAPGHAAATINSGLGVLATYWTWMVSQGHLPEDTPNHWPMFRRKRDTGSADETERAFTDAEVTALLAPNDNSRGDVMDISLLATLTGGRIEELARLKVRHVAPDLSTLHLPGTKTDAAPRTIPLHPQLKPLVKSRVRGKDGEDWLFPELPERDDDSAMGRSSTVSKAFTRYRRAIGVDDKVEGKRRARTNFHSFRRWFSTKLAENGTPHDVVDTIMGWTRPGMRGRYTVNADFMKQMRKAVDEVKLPVRAPTPRHVGPSNRSSQ